MKLSQPRRQILFLNRSYWPDIEATGQLLTDLCRGLTGRFDVHVVCGQPNSPERNCHYRKQGTSVHDGVTIHRLRHQQFRKKNPFGRILNLVSFYHAAQRYLARTRLSPALVISETDPFLLPLAGAKYSRQIGAKHCVYLQDIYPDVAEAVGKLKLPLIASRLRPKLQQAYRDADRIIVLGRCMRQRLVRAPWELPEDKIETIPNWADCETVRPVDPASNAFRRRLGLEDAFVVMHSGNMGLTQRLDVLIDAAADPQWPQQARLLLVGNGASRDRLIRQAERLRLLGNRIQFLDYQPRSALAESLSAADVHVVSMHQRITGCLCPSKLYGILAAGRPVIAVADPETDLWQTIDEGDLGWCVPPGSPGAIAQAVARASKETRAESLATFAPALLDRQRRARDQALCYFDRPVVVQKFEQVLCSILSDESLDVQKPAPIVTLDPISTEAILTP
ncbi:glycosyltransferase family 4 protein [Roseiconus nitratireducens]|uniref:Glycosyltransferase family 4 protein n=1 Tax=Roseiconus nitratireducens TaxID=2605748 RepID=A0A5M6DCK1_9BACT|nr:glycosyltransferase family 4 protein [Roseiconus nitratireducens]KAA5543809.1 glycosyltransferase family 4 protein [Roseiconus nitratireducens]